MPRLRNPFHHRPAVSDSNYSIRTQSTTFPGLHELANSHERMWEDFFDLMTKLKRQTRSETAKFVQKYPNILSVTDGSPSSARQIGNVESSRGEPANDSTAELIARLQHKIQDLGERLGRAEQRLDVADVRPTGIRPGGNPNINADSYEPAPWAPDSPSRRPARGRAKSPIGMRPQSAPLYANYGSRTPPRKHDSPPERIPIWERGRPEEVNYNSAQYRTPPGYGTDGVLDMEPGYGLRHQRSGTNEPDYARWSAEDPLQPSGRHWLRRSGKSSHLRRASRYG